jgi:hypothetical protein
MTPSILKNLLKISLLLLLIQLYVSTNAQHADTLVVYEFVFIKDTIWVDRHLSTEIQEYKKLNHIDNAAIILDTDHGTREGLLIFPIDQGATFPANRIMIAENIKRKSMKRFALFGITFLALNSSLFAQPEIKKNIGFYLRGSFYNHITKFYSDVLRGGIISGDLFSPAIGVRGNYPLGRNFSFSPGMGFSHMNSYAEIKQNPVDHSMGLIVGKRYYFLSSDLHLNYYFLKGSKVLGRLYGGARADCFLGTKKDANQVGNVNGTNTPISYDVEIGSFMENDETLSIYHNPIVFNSVIGVGFDIGNRFFAELELSNNINLFINTEYIRMRYDSFSLNIGFYLF